MNTYLKLLKEKIPKGALTQYYAIEMNSVKDCAEHFGVTFHAINALIKEYSIVKDKHAATSAKMLEVKNRHFNEIKEHISKEELYKYYIEEDHTYEETKKYYGLAEWTFVRLLREYNIKKDRHVSGKRGVVTKYAQAGGKDIYEQKAHEKSVQTKIEKYGSYDAYKEYISSKCSTTWNAMSPERKQEIHDRTMAHGGGWNKDTIIQTLKDKYGVDNAYKLATKFQTNSKVNQAIADKLDNIGIEYSREFLLEDKRYDFKIDNILIEINPWPFHNSSWCPISNANPLAKNYHADKSNVASRNNYHCIHIWDWDDIDIVLKIIAQRKTLGGRQCDVKNVEQQEAKEFLNNYHIQGYARDTVRYGLYFNDELCAIMTFGKPRYNKNYEWELIRYCSKYNIIGGAEKLLKMFITENNPQSIISYCDNSKFSGKVYNKLGFKFIKKYAPSKHWYNIKTGKHITDNLLRQRGFDQLFGTDYGKGTSNEQLMLENQFVEIYDCGQSVYAWTKPESEQISQ